MEVWEEKDWLEGVGFLDFLKSRRKGDITSSTYTLCRTLDGSRSCLRSFRLGKSLAPVWLKQVGGERQDS